MEDDNVPSGWKAARLDEVCDILDSKRVPLNNHERSKRQGVVPYWGANGIIDYIDDYIFDEPLILMAEDGGYFEQSKTRPICHLLDGKSWVNNHAHILRVRPGQDRKWVYYWFVHRNVTQYINIGTRAKLNMKDLRQLPLLLPPLAEQKRIIAILSSIEDVINAVQAVIDQWLHVKKGLVQQLFTRGVGSKKLLETACGVIPEGWQATKIERIVHKMMSGGTPSKKNQAYWNGDIPWASVKDIINYTLEDTQEYITEEGLNNSAAKLIPKNTLIMAIRMAIGKTAIAARDLAINQDLRSIEFTDKMDITFMHQWFQWNEKRIASLGVGTTVPGIRQQVVHGLSIHVPPLVEQQRIAEILMAVDYTIPPAQKMLQQVKLLKQGVMADLLAGKVRVSGFDLPAETGNVPDQPSEDSLLFSEELDATFA